MPNPKVGTVTLDVTKAVRELKAGRIEFRVEKAGIVQTPDRQGVVRARASWPRTCTRSSTPSCKLKPSTAKGSYVKSITISTTLGPGIKIDTAAFQATARSDASASPRIPTRPSEKQAAPRPQALRRQSRSPRSQGRATPLCTDEGLRFSVVRRDTMDRAGKAEISATSRTSSPTCSR